MKRRKIDPETKMAAALEELKGEGSFAEICRKYQISESLYYRWRDKFLEAGSRALASRNGSGPEAAAKTKISEQERIIGKQAEAGFPDLKYLGSRDPAGEAQILARIREIKLRHPFWGYRRVRAWLKYREDLPVGHKRVYRLRRENELLVPQKRYRAKRQPAGLKPRAQRPGQFWGIDLTKFIIPDLGWAYLVIVLDWLGEQF